MSRPIGDMKQGLTGSRPKLSIVPRAVHVHTTRVLEYGADKYARGNYHGSPPTGVSAVERVLGYLDATVRHITRVTDAINHALGTGGDLAAALATVDDDGGGKFPASNLPDLSHALTSLGLAVTVAVDDGLLPADPGQPWKSELAPEVGLPQKDDPAAERARVAALCKGPEVAALDYLIAGGKLEDAERLFGKTTAMRAAIARANANAPSERNAQLIEIRVEAGAYDVAAQVTEATNLAVNKRAPGCTSSECSIRNACTGAAACPKTPLPFDGAGLTPEQRDAARMRATDAALATRELEPSTLVPTSHSDPTAKDAHATLAANKVIP